MSTVWPKVSVKASAEDFSQQFQNAAVKSGAVLIEVSSPQKHLYLSIISLVSKEACARLSLLAWFGS